MFRMILAMSADLKSVKDDIRRAVNQIDKHIIKLALYPNVGAKDHWRAEIYSFLSDVPKLKGSNKFPKQNVIRSELATYEDTFDTWVPVIKKNNKNLTPANISVEDILSCAMEYHDWLAFELSTKGIVSVEDVFNKLEELGL